MKKKLLFLAPDLTSGGAERQMVTVALLLQKYYHVEFVCYARADFFLPLLEKNNIKVHWLTEDNYLKRIFRIRSFIRKGNYTAVISFLSTANFLNNFSALGGVKWKVITGERSAKQATFKSKRGKVFATFQKNTDTIICNSENAAGLWRKYYPKYKNKIQVIYNAVIIPEIELVYIPRRDGKTHLLIAASYVELKNSINLVKALSLLNLEERLQIHVDWYGRIPESDTSDTAYFSTKELIEEESLQDVIKLHDATTEIATKMQEADVVGLFSRVEGLPNAICEGMSLGKPVIMSKVSDYDKFIHPENGLLCDWDNPKSIKEALLKLINLPTQNLLKMGEESKRIAKQLFSQGIVTQHWISVIEK